MLIKLRFNIYLHYT